MGAGTLQDAERKLSEIQNRGVAARVREEIARRRISRQWLADDARISLSTLEKALSGHRPFTLATLIRLETALGLRLRDADPVDLQGDSAATPGHAPEHLGGYSRASVSWIEGNYVTLRPSFGVAGAIYAYRTEISWSEDATCMLFQESDRLDTSFTQRGSVSVPSMSGHIYLTTNIAGQHRLIVVSRPTIDGEMHGVLTTLQAGRGAQLMPVSTSIVLIPRDRLENFQYGRIVRGAPCFSTYYRYLDRTVGDAFASFLPGV